jgi:hypothetical protein
MEPPSYENSLQPSGNVILKHFTQPANKVALFNDLKNWQGEDFPSFEDVIVSRITDEQEKMMAMSFALWRSDQTEQFPITVDEKVLKMLGYSRKDNFKRDLLKDFGDGDETDWILLKSEEPNEMTLNNVNGPGKAWRAETIKITGDVFKSMALRSNSSIGKASRSYFVSLENIMFCYMEASNEWKTTKQIAAKDTEMIEAIQAKDIEMQEIKEELEEAKRAAPKWRENVKKEIVYVFTTKQDVIRQIFKIGRTRTSTNKRVKELQTGNSDELEEVFAFYTSNATLLERVVHIMFESRGWKYRNEWFQIPLHVIKTCITVFGNVIETFNTIGTPTSQELIERFEQIDILSNLHVPRVEVPKEVPQVAETELNPVVPRFTTLEQAVDRFITEKIRLEIGLKVKSGVIIAAFIQWCLENKIELHTDATNKLSPAIQEGMMRIYGHSVRFNPICSFKTNGRRVQTPGFTGARCL